MGERLPCTQRVAGSSPVVSTKKTYLRKGLGMIMARLPYVIEEHGDGERSYDLYSRMLKDRIIFISGAITSESADNIVAQLLFLEAQDAEKDINMYINSPGGEVTAMYAMFDTMNYIRPDVVTIGYGTVASAASFILAAGARGKRYALPNTEIMIHELSSGAAGKYNDIRTHYEHVSKLYEKMAKDYVKLTGQTLKRIKEDMRIDNYMTPEEAKNYGKYGLLDNIQGSR